MKTSQTGMSKNLKVRHVTSARTWPTWWIVVAILIGACVPKWGHNKWADDDD